MKRVRAFAPATVANVAVGFDILGFPVDGVGDEILLTRTDTPGIVIEAITKRGASDPRSVFSELPTDPRRNTATVGLLQWMEDAALPFGFKVRIEKGIPLSSGMGGSAASSVGALVAASRFLKPEPHREALLKYAVMGEFLASGSAHADNVSPCLFGGLTLTRSVDPFDVVSIPVPSPIRCVLVHPDLRLDTRTARGVLKKEIGLKEHVKQSAHLAGFVAGCYRNDIALIQRSFTDLLIEPQRAPLLKGFEKVKAAALGAGALGCSISGSGPSVFAWTSSETIASQVKLAMVLAFEGEGVKADAWISSISATGAKVLEEEE